MCILEFRVSILKILGMEKIKQVRNAQVNIEPYIYITFGEHKK